MISSLARDTVRRCSARLVSSGKTSCRRNMANMPVPQSRDAKLFEQHPTEPQGWETSVYIYSAISAVLLFVNAVFTPDTTIESWAHNEAAARLRLKEDHGFSNFEFGKHYQDFEAEKRQEKWDEVANKEFHPFKEEEEEDDDDDDDDDDDE